LLLLFGRFYSGVDPGDQIGLISVDAGNFRPLTNDMIDHQGLALSADGKKFATLLKRSSSEIGFYDTSRAALNSNTRLPRTAYSLVWLDEDRLLMDAAGLTAFRRSNGEFADFDVIFPPGDHEHGMWGSSTSNTSPAVCQDGDLILTGSVDGAFQLYLVDANRQFLRTLVKIRGGDMFCNPKNESAYYSEADSKEPSIWSVPLAGGSPRKLMSIPHAAPIVYSSDGRYAAYILDNGGRSIATILNLDQRKIMREIPLSNHAQGTLPHFTHDGGALAFVEQQKEGFALALQPIDGSAPRILTTWFKDPISEFDWSPSGKTLAIMWDRSTSDVALITDKSTKPRD
jgi:Tol biopolymer transport system component